MRLSIHRTKKAKKIRGRLYSSIAVLSLAVSLAAGAAYVSPVDTYAKTAKQKRDEAKKNLEKTNDQISDIKDDQATNATELKTASNKLNKLLAEQKALAKDIEDKQAEVEQANKELKEAQKVEAKQYKSMKLRIQYMYENSTDNSLWTAILESDGISDMLNRIEYVSDLYQSDRDLMDSYQAAVQQVTDWTEQLADDMNNLLALQDEYDAKQGELETAVAKLEKQKENYKQQAASNYQGGGSGSSGGFGNDSYLNDPSYNPSNATNVSGADIVAYARQFVGNPYVWGGNSLTNGVDCSGFVHQVYAHFGISTPRYSQAFRTVGQPVSYQNIQAGDVIVYPGHVAICVGNGTIVEAQSTRAGITEGRSVNCHTILAIRRLV